MASIKCFRPRRGKKGIMDSSGTVLQSGELFFEVPDEGVGKGECKVKIGDGSTTYANLPYAINLDDVRIDPQTFEITFNEPSSSTSLEELLEMISDGADLSTIIGAMKVILQNMVSSVTDLESDSDSGKVGTSTVGSNTRPVWLNAGTITALSTTVGGTAQPIYSNGGTLTACSSTVGSGTRPVYMSTGTITALGTTVGGGAQPIYSNGGTLTACSSTVGSGTKPVYMNSGTITAIGTTVGSSNTPIYSNGGTLTACSAMMPLTGSTFTGVAYAQTNTSYTTYQLRNIAFTTSVPSSLTNGYVCMVYDS